MRCVGDAAGLCPALLGTCVAAARLWQPGDQGHGWRNVKFANPRVRTKPPRPSELSESEQPRMSAMRTSRRFFLTGASALAAAVVAGHASAQDVVGDILKSSTR